MKATTCFYCKGCGFFPFCPKCTRDVNGRLIVKKKSNYLTDDEIRERHRIRDNLEDLTRMFRNMRKVDADPMWPLSQIYLIMYKGNLKTSGCKITDPVLFDLYGEPDEWT